MDIYIVGKPEEAIISKFYYELGHIRINVYGSLDVYEDKVSDFVRLIQDNFYAKHRRQ